MDGCSEAMIPMGKECLPLGTGLRGGGGGGDPLGPSKSRKRKWKDFISKQGKRKQKSHTSKTTKQQQKHKNKLKPSKPRKNRCDGPEWRKIDPWTIHDQIKEDRQLRKAELKKFKDCHDSLCMSFCMIIRADLGKDANISMEDDSS